MLIFIENMFQNRRSSKIVKLNNFPIRTSWSSAMSLIESQSNYHLYIGQHQSKYKCLTLNHTLNGSAKRDSCQINKAG